MNRTDSILSPQRAADLSALLLRLGLGAVFVAHALVKLLVFTLPGTAQFFAAHGLPGWAAYPVFVVELAGGAALLGGWNSRPVALALIPVMLGALFVHLPQGWMFTNQGGGWEYVAFLILALGAQALLGDGALAVGRLGRGWAARIPLAQGSPEPVAER
jgi:putative oxidoreductase